MYLFTRPMDKAKNLTILAAAAAALVAAAAAVASTKSTNLTFVAYSTPKPVMAKIISAYQSPPPGQGGPSPQSYGPPTTQAKAVAAGQPADFVFLSAGDDVNL